MWNIRCRLPGLLKGRSAVMFPWNSRRLWETGVGRYPKVIYFSEIVADGFCTKMRHCHRTSFRSIVKILSVLYNLKWDVL